MNDESPRLNTRDPRFRAGLRLTLAREWYEAHEAFEEQWRAAEGAPGREVLQGIIQLLVALTHLQRGNALGAFNVWTRAQGKLKGVEDWGGIALGAWGKALRAFFTGEVDLATRVKGQLEGGVAAGEQHIELAPLPPLETWPVPDLDDDLAAWVADE